MSVVTTSDFQKGMFIEFKGETNQIVEFQHVNPGKGSAFVRTKLKNLKTGQILARNFKPADIFEEAGIKKQKVKYLYHHRDEYWFSEEQNPKNRFVLSEEQLGDTIRFLKPNTTVEALNFKENMLNINLPIKMDFKVVEAPLAIRGNTAQGGNKTVTIETGAQIIAPLFINEGDTIRVNTQTGMYVERTEKGH